MLTRFSHISIKKQKCVVLFPDMHCVKNMYKTNRCRYIGQQPGKKGGCRSMDIPVVYCGFRFSSNLHGKSFGRVSEKKLEVVAFDAQDD